MGASEISNIGKMFVQGQTTDVKGGKQQEDELGVVFAEVMSQMQTHVGDKMISEDDGMDAGITGVTYSSSVDTGYERYENHSVKLRDTATSDEINSETVDEKLGAYADDVKEVLKEELGVTEEQIEDAMKTLGLSFSDLLNPNQLASLVAQLTGAEDMSALLCSEDFMIVMQSVGELSENLLKELGISSEQFAQMMVDAQNALDVNVQEQAAFEFDEAQFSAQELQNIQNPSQVENVSKVLEQETQTDGKFVVDEKVTTDESESDSGALEVSESDSDALDEPESVEDVAENAENENSRDEMFSGQQKAENFSAENRNGMAGSMNQNVTDASFAQTQENVRNVASQVDVSDIMEQIVEYSKVSLADKATTMEMQLNPENLGKIYLEVTSKDGMVSAHITAQNEVVKEALESQLVELRQNLNQAGVKVDAVEVSVGSHEFEKNLEQNARQQERQAEEQEKVAKQTRRINLNDLDGLQGIMTEEESLVAQMMADHGNSIDFTA